MRAIAIVGVLFAAGSAAAEPAFPKFKMQEIATDLTVGYAVVVADINGDGKPDIVVVDSKRVVWYENPTWKVRPIITGKTKPDNVCITALDIDGDGNLDLVLGADWRPFDTKTGGTLQWLQRGKTLDEEWSVHPIGEEPMVHRVRVADIDGSGKKAIVHVPLIGREATKEANWMDGRPVRVLAYHIPKDPVKGPWEPIVLNEELHVCHNFWPVAGPKSGGPNDIYITAYEGVFRLRSTGQKWSAEKLGAGNQANLKGNRGASEIKLATMKNDKQYIATIEPWHGNEVVVYPTDAKADGLLKRVVIDDHLRWGHGVWCADLDGDGDEELIIGVRDLPTKGDTFTEKWGVRIYKAVDDTRTKWARQIIDEGVAVEDLTAADLNGDGKIDIVAVGRKTGNARILWNQGK
jgi:Aldos-2-ulose dehydratase, beta-propeller domain/FG-GAP-like repeat